MVGSKVVCSNLVELAAIRLSSQQSGFADLYVIEGKSVDSNLVGLSSRCSTASGRDLFG